MRNVKKRYGFSGESVSETKISYLFPTYPKLLFCYFYVRRGEDCFTVHVSHRILEKNEQQMLHPMKNEVCSNTDH